MSAHRSRQFKRKISNESPVGAALMGRKIGETVEVETQAGVCLYKILKSREQTKLDIII